jgi:hypothetical protein
MFRVAWPGQSDSLAVATWLTTESNAFVRGVFKVRRNTFEATLKQGFTGTVSLDPWVVDVRMRAHCNGRVCAVLWGCRTGRLCRKPSRRRPLPRPVQVGLADRPEGGLVPPAFAR